jgi:cell division septation protein DedD
MVPRPRTGAEDAPRIVEAAGQITDARLAHTMAASLPDAQSRAKILATREVWLQRRPLAQKGERGGPTVPIDLPAAVPVATVANSWLTYDDPDGRFQFRHPQDLQPPSLPDRTRAAVDLEDTRAGGSRFGLKLPPTGGETQDPSFRDAAHFQKAHEDQFASADISWGKPGWLDDPVWQDLSGKVYRMEGAWKRDNAETPVYIDLYYVELDRNRPTQRFVVESWTVRPDHLAFRNQTEEMIRLFKLGRPEKRVLASPGMPSDPRTAPSAGSTPAPADSAPAPTETGEPAAAKTAKPATAPVAPPQ